MKKLHLMLFPLLTAFALCLAGCGGGDDGNDEEAVVKTIEIAATSTNPADCKKYATPAFLEQTQFEEGADALKECEEDAGDTDGDPDSVKVAKVEIDGSDATAEASFVGGTFEGQTLALKLVEENGTWKMDEIVRFAKLDQDRYAESFEEGVTSGDNQIPRPVASCIGEVFRSLSQSELEDVVLTKDPQGLIELVERCQQRSGASAEA
ncbi:MAG: hypothetical protein ABW065_02630 [Solirubrobacterales bacterium]